MPKDSAATRSAILAAAVHTLKRAGLEGFTVEGVAARAGVVKGLVLYHYASRNRLLRLAAARLASERAGGLARALARGPGEGAGGAAALDACWEELRRQTEDGTTRAWLGLTAAGLIERLGTGGFEGTAREAVIDGCAAALAAGVPLDHVRDAYHALWLALLDVGEAAG